MAGAMLDGWLAAGLDPTRFTIVSPNRTEAPPGVRLLRAIPDEAFDAVLLGIKPQMLAALAPQIAGHAKGSTAILSVLAGVELATLAQAFPDSQTLVRVMPNLAAALGKSPLPLVTRGLDGSGRDALGGFLAPLGEVEFLDDETAFDLVTALAGSGPAFVYRFIDALAAAAAKLGLPPDQAFRLALAMADGAVALAAASPHSPGELAQRVASPGGVTQKGLDVLDAGRALNGLIEQTLRAARDRSAEMAAGTRPPG